VDPSPLIVEGFYNTSPPSEQQSLQVLKRNSSRLSGKINGGVHTVKNITGKKQ
jgi:hypothetical protein